MFNTTLYWKRSDWLCLFICCQMCATLPRVCLMVHAAMLQDLTSAVNVYNMSLVKYVKTVCKYVIIWGGRYKHFNIKKDMCIL